MGMRLRIAAAMTVAVGLLAACGSGAGDPASSASASASAGPESTGAAASVLIWTDPDHAAALQASAADHGQATGVEVVVATIGEDLADLRAEVATLAPQGLGPDLFVGRSEWVGSLVESGLVAAQDASRTAGSFRAVAVNGFQYSGRQYGVPFATDNIALVRNTDLAKRAPKSIDQMARLGLALAETTKQRVLPIALPVGSGGDALHWYPLYSAAGGALFGRDSRGGYTSDEVEVGQPGSVAAARQLAALTRDGAVDERTTEADAVAAFTSGRSPYLIAGPAVIDAVRESGVPFVVEAVPGFSDVLASRSQALVSSLGILSSSFSRNSSGAQQYLATTLRTTEVMSALAAPGGLGPAWRLSYDEVAAADPVVEGFGAYADDSVAIPNLPGTDDVWPVLGEAEVEVMTGSPPAATMKTAGRSIQREVDDG